MHPLDGPLEIKLFAEGEDIPSSRELVPVFHRWIQTERLPEELLIDVADYSHVYRGPGVILVGGDVQYGMDSTDGRPGLAARHNRSRGVGPSLGLRDIFFRAFRAASLLETDAGLEQRLCFRKDELRFRVHDRLLAPNVRSTFESVAPELKAFLKDLCRTSVRLEPEGYSRQPFTIRISFEADLDLAAALEHLGARLGLVRANDDLLHPR